MNLQLKQKNKLFIIILLTNKIIIIYMLKNYYGFISLIIILIAIMFLPLATIFPSTCKCRENYENINSTESHLLNYFPVNKTKKVNSDNYSHDWIYYPIFPVGSYEQITNNLKYFKNPDEGTCIPAEFCGDFYHDRNLKPDINIIKPLPPVSNDPGIRVGYYRTKEDLFLSAQPGSILELPAF
jgi:hypothetical protein